MLKVTKENLKKQLVKNRVTEIINKDTITGTMEMEMETMVKETENIKN
jgi:hypothetical protein